MKNALIWPFLACLILPLIAAWFAWPATHLPPGFGIFPPEQVPGTPGFNLWVFCLLAAFCAVIVALYLFPARFGFQPVTPPPEPQKYPLPARFWAGLLITLFFWWLMWKRITPFGTLVYFAFTPMWWGFILLLDGLNWHRGGWSLIANRPRAFAISALVSVGGWTFYEYFNYFVLSDWYYPNGHMAALPHAEIVLLFLLAYTTVWPAIFEWLTLLLSFPRLRVRYSNGPQLKLSGSRMLLIGFLLIVATVFLPYPLFWGIWIGPLAVLAGQLLRKRIWTPFTALQQGDWGPFMLSALASLCNGIFWELWNHGSESPNFLSGQVPPFPTNPNFWIYDIPYVNVLHPYSEMPLLGYFGYLPFGVLVWVFFIWAGNVLGFSTNLGPAELGKPSSDR